MHNTTLYIHIYVLKKKIGEVTVILKTYKDKRSFTDFVKEIYSDKVETSNTVIAFDANGVVNIENFKRIADYGNSKIVLETKEKSIYIYGENLSLLSCRKNCAVCTGNISKIELF